MERTKWTCAFRPPPLIWQCDLTQHPVTSASHRGSLETSAILFSNLAVAAVAAATATGLAHFARA